MIFFRFHRPSAVAVRRNLTISFKFPLTRRVSSGMSSGRSRFPCYRVSRICAQFRESRASRRAPAAHFRSTPGRSVAFSGKLTNDPSVVGHTSSHIPCKQSLNSNPNIRRHSTAAGRIEFSDRPRRDRGAAHVVAGHNDLARPGEIGSETDGRSVHSFRSGRNPTTPCIVKSCVNHIRISTAFSRPVRTGSRAAGSRACR